MGLTIHYALSTELTTATKIGQLLQVVRQFALDLPFAGVGEIFEFSGDDSYPDNDSIQWLRIQAEGRIECKGRYYRVPPKRCIAFPTWPGEGCESANIGFCTYPAFLHVEGKRIDTKLRGWQWSSFCKTEYASNPHCGGVANFLRCHLLVIKLLDFIKATNLVHVEVDDEGGYWEQRNIESLVKEVGNWNEFLAGLTNQIRNAAASNGSAIEAAITGFPNFEHLEAKGLDRLAKLRAEVPNKS
jgi:hypothetical protein